MLPHRRIHREPVPAGFAPIHERRQPGTCPAPRNGTPSVGAEPNPSRRGADCTTHSLDPEFDPDCWQVFRLLRWTRPCKISTRCNLSRYRSFTAGQQGLRGRQLIPRQCPTWRCPDDEESRLGARCKDWRPGRNRPPNQQCPQTRISFSAIKQRTCPFEQPTGASFGCSPCFAGFRYR